MRTAPSLFVVALAVLALAALPVAGSAAQVDVEPQSADIDPPTAEITSQTADVAHQSADVPDEDDVTHVDDDDDPSSSETIGYYEGYAYDDELTVDDSDDATVDEDELDSVVYRSMARVEVLRELPFDEEVTVDVVSREEFEDESDEMFADVDEEGELYENVRYEALFMVDRETDAVDEYADLYGGTVGGYYDPAADRIVLVSDNPEEPDVDEVTLGHELLHALQDQYFDLGSFDRETQDQDNAKNGLIEGDAVWIDTEYEQRCGVEWSCLPEPATDDGGGEPVNWGMYFTIFQPYDDGPEYVDHLLNEGDWEAVNDAYDDPPASSSEVIRPGEEREPAGIEIEDRSSDEWTQHEVAGDVQRETIGEAGMASMFGGDVMDGQSFERPDGGDDQIDAETFFDIGPGGAIDEIRYDQPFTDGWAGDELVVYSTDGTNVEESGFVWETEWVSEADAEAFVDGYLQLLALNDAADDEEYADTFVVDDGFPGAYAIDQDGESVTIVNAPSVEDLDGVEADSLTAGEGSLSVEEAGETADSDGVVDDGGASDADRSVDADPVPGFGAIAAVAAILGLVVVAIRR